MGTLTGHREATGLLTGGWFWDPAFPKGWGRRGTGRALEMLELGRRHSQAAFVHIPVAVLAQLKPYAWAEHRRMTRSLWLIVFQS